MPTRPYGSYARRPKRRPRPQPSATRPYGSQAARPTPSISSTPIPPTIYGGTSSTYQPVPQTVPRLNLVDREERTGRRARAPRAQAPKPRTAKVEVPEVVPPRYRKAVATHGQRLNQPLKQAGVDMTGPEYLARLIQFESGWDPTARNPSSAFGFGQFIDSTAEDFRNRLGIETQDPNRPRQMIKGASVHAGGKAGYNPLYAGYNPGYSSTDPIPGVEAGNNVSVRVPRKRLRRVAEGQVATGGGGQAAQGPPQRALDRWLQNRESDAEVASQLGVPERRAHIQTSRLDPDLQRALVRTGRRSGEPIMVNEGFRTRSRQEALASGRGGATGPAAAPGTSQHEFGRAVDADLTPEQDRIARSLGLTTPVSGEPWHYELADGGSGTQPIGGGVASGSSPSPSPGFASPGPAPSASARPSLSDVLSGGARRGPPPSSLAARAPLPGGRRGDEDEEEEETLAELLRRLGRA